MDFTLKFKKGQSLSKSNPRCSSAQHYESQPQQFRNRFASNQRLMRSTPRCPSWQPYSPPMDRSYVRMTPRYRPQSDMRNSMMPDPTAPHLKYGLFSNKVLSPRTCCKLMKRNDSPGNRSLPMRQRPEHAASLLPPPPRFRSQNTAHIIKPTKIDKIQSKNARLAMSPVIAYQPSFKQLEHKLSLSKIMHLDIKPRRTPSPVFLPPSLRMLMSPNSRAFR